MHCCVLVNVVCDPINSNGVHDNRSNFVLLSMYHTALSKGSYCVAQAALARIKYTLLAALWPGAVPGGPRPSQANVLTTPAAYAQCGSMCYNLGGIGSMWRQAGHVRHVVIWVPRGVVGGIGACSAA